MISRWIILLFLLFLLYLGILYAPPKYIEIETTAMTLSPENTDEYGTSELVNILDSLGYEIIYGGPSNLTSLSRHDIYILIGPDISLSDREIQYVKDFLDRGGSILIADELGTVNNLLKALFGAKIDEEYTALYWNMTQKIKSSVNTSETRIYPYIYTYAYAGLDVPPTKFFKELFESQVNPLTFINLVDDHKSDNPYNSLIVGPNLPSYIDEIGNLNISGLILSPSKNYLERELSSETLTNLTLKDLDINIFSAYYENGDSRVYIVSDTSIFTNEYIKYFKLAGSDSFYVSLLSWLNPNIESSGPYGSITISHKVVFDTVHYKPFIVKQPMPPPGKILNSLISPLIGELSPDKIYDMFYNFMGMATIFLIGIPITIVGMYLYLVRYLGISTKRVREPEIIERELISESITLRMIRGERREKKFYMDMIIALYDFLDQFFIKLYNINLTDIIEESIPPNLNDRLGDRGKEELVKLTRKIYSLKRKIVEKKKFPIVISWHSTFKRLIVLVDNILKLLGYEFMYHKEGLKKIEYLFR